jgi:hypothetical protein
VNGSDTAVAGNQPRKAQFPDRGNRHTTLIQPAGSPQAQLGRVGAYTRPPGNLANHELRRRRPSRSRPAQCAARPNSPIAAAAADARTCVRAQRSREARARPSCHGGAATQAAVTLRRVCATVAVAATRDRRRGGGVGGADVAGHVRRRRGLRPLPQHAASQPEAGIGPG